jgi:uncharacterized membrane protein
LGPDSRGSLDFFPFIGNNARIADAFMMDLTQTPPPDSRDKSDRGERFTRRLEAFSDLVFGFSLSLLATRLDVPQSQADIFEATRWGTFAITFGMICAIWLTHYRIFRHRFVAGPADVVVNFIFLFGIAVLPYAVQTFLRFEDGRNSTILYFSDFTLIFAALAALRFSALRQRRGDADAEVRLREWRGTVRQFTIVVAIVGALIALNAGVIPKGKILQLGAAAIIAATLITRLVVQRLPKFLL